VEEGRLDLDATASRFGVALPGPGRISVRHLLSHTSEGVPGRTYRYNGARFAELDKVIADVTGQSFARAVAARVLDPIGLRDTAPTPDAAGSCAEAGRDPARFARRLARGYGSDGVTPVAYPSYFGTAAGLVSTARDMARFSLALDAGRLLQPETWRLAVEPARTAEGARLPYGLGWFVQERGGVPLIWHYGLWTGISSLIVKVPTRDLTLVLLANSDGLSAPFDLGRGDLLRSPFALAFLDAFAR